VMRNMTIMVSCRMGAKDCISECKIMVGEAFACRVASKIPRSFLAF